MLMNHKNFRLTQITDKTDDVVFLKSQKTLLLGNSGSAMHNYIWVAPNNRLRFRKTNEPILRKLIERHKDGRTDRPYFIGPF